MRTGLGYDVHPFSPGEGFTLGGVRVPFDKGLKGHSDADVLLHAICDALLGACALGDLGTHFPDTDPSYQGISSLRLLETVAKMVRDEGFAVINIDSTIMAQRPRLAGFIPQMVDKIAVTLSLPARQVSVKATTTEGLGFVGRCEGIACLAVTMVRSTSLGKTL
ncbi:MAG: 2-C-methyl-D-erythritol 2,4-cyclodiphosphate synthase [Thermodesulfobacteriota bacterium]